MNNKLEVDLLAYHQFEEKFNRLNEMILPHGSSHADRSNPDPRLMMEINEAFAKVQQTKTITIDDFLNPELSLATELLLSKFAIAKLYSLPVGSAIRYANASAPTARDHFKFASVGSYETDYSDMVRIVGLRVVKAEEIVDASAVEELIRKYHSTMIRNHELRAEYRDLLENEELRDFFRDFDYPTVGHRDLDPVIQFEFANHPFTLAVIDGDVFICGYPSAGDGTLGGCLKWLHSMKNESDHRTAIVQERRDSEDNPNPSFAVLEQVDANMIESNPFYSFIWRSGDNRNKIGRPDHNLYYHSPRFIIVENMSTWRENMIRAIDANLEFARNLGKEHSFNRMQILNYHPSAFEISSLVDHFEYGLADGEFWFGRDLELDLDEDDQKYFEGYYPTATFAQLVPLVRSNLDKWYFL